MATSSKHGIRVAVITTALIIALIISPSKSDEMMYINNKLKSKRLVLGSRPPDCVHKCLSCKPCIATLVVPPRYKIKGVIPVKSYDYGVKGNNHDMYYLLAWKCKCGNKLFQP